jgi:hypothetical protein
MRRARPVLIALCAVAALTVAGCGGPDIAYREVTSPPPTLPVPRDADTLASPSASATPTVTPTATAASGTTSSGTTSTGATSTGGTAPAPAATTAPSTGTGGTTGGTGTTQQQPSGQDTGGATADQGLDQFCADNPGACDGGQK